MARSFFQLIGRKKSRFLMHDLITDLAKFVEGDTCLHLDGKSKNDSQHSIFKSVLHSSYISYHDDVFKRFERFHKKSYLHTFINIAMVT